MHDVRDEPTRAAGSRTAIAWVLLCCALPLGALRPPSAAAAVCPEAQVCRYSRHLYAAWSPDGTRIALAAFRGYQNGIAAVNADGTGSVERIGPVGEPEGSNTAYLYRTYPTWSPDGTRIAYSTSGPVVVNDAVGPDDIFVSPVDITTTSVLNLTNHPSQDFHPRWSPDGTRIAFASDRDGDFEIYTIRPDGTDLRQLTHNDASDSHPGSWSPDGHWIAFVSDRDGNAEIYLVNADGTGETRLTSDPATDSHPAYSPDGGRIAFHSDRDGNHEIYAMSADGSGVTRLTNRSADDHDPNWSPDGGRIAFATDVDYPAGDFFDIHTIRPDGTDEARVTFSNEVSLAGKKLSLKAESDGSIKQLKAQSVRAITPTPDPAWSPAAGASLRVMGTGFDATYPLSAQLWREVRSPIFFLPSFDYRSSAGPVRSIRLRANSGLRVVASGGLAGSLLADPGPVRIVLSTGRMRYCLEFTTAKAFEPGRRYVAIDAPAPAACPP